MSLFSVVLPVYNRKEVISNAINSVLNQTFSDWELLIIDDFSSDGTYEFLLNFTHPKIKLLRTKINSGPSIARNVGIKESKGELISFLDSDDFYHVDFLKESYHVIKNTNENVGFFWTGLTVEYGTGIREEIWDPPKNKSTYLSFLNSLHIGTNSGLTIKREVFNKIGMFNENLVAAEDTEFLLRISQEYLFEVIKHPLIFINKKQENRLSKDFSKIAQSYNIFILDHMSTIESEKTLQKKYYYKLMWLNYHLGDSLRAREYFKLLFKSSNLSIKSIVIFFIFEFFGKNLGSKIHKILA